MVTVLEALVADDYLLRGEQFSLHDWSCCQSSVGASNARLRLAIPGSYPSQEARFSRQDPQDRPGDIDTGSPLLLVNLSRSCGVQEAKSEQVEFGPV